MKRFIVLAAAALVLAGCAKDKAETRVPVKISPVITKVTDVNFEAGDKIGVTINQKDVQYAKNQPLTYAGDVFSGELVWYMEAAVTSSVIAYYPYSESGEPASFKVASDQSASLSGSDLVAGTKDDVLPTEDAVVIPFKHLLSKVVLEITNESKSDISSVVLRNSRTEASVDLKALTATVSESSSTEDIKTCEITKNERYAAIVVPQNVAFELVVTTSAGKELSQKLSSAELQQGGQYTISATVLPDDLKVRISGDIEGWTDEGKLSPDTPVSVDFAEYDGYFVYKNQKYNTVTLSDGSVWMAQPMRYVPDGFTPSSDPTADSHIWNPYTLDNGTAKPSDDAELVKKNGYLYDLYAAFGGKEITEQNAASFEGTQGICPNGWHIPTRAEYLSLCGYSNSAVGEAAGGKVDETALFYNAEYKGGKVSLFNAANWNLVLTGWRQKASYTATAKYSTNVLSSKNTSVEAYYGSPALTYLISSTFYKAGYSKEVLSQIQFFAGMTTFTGSYMEGRVILAFQHCESGAQLRCVKNKK